jgi:hypothetical protein
MNLFKRIAFAEVICVLDPPRGGLGPKAINHIRRNEAITKLVRIYFMESDQFNFCVNHLHLVLISCLKAEHVPMAQYQEQFRAIAIRKPDKLSSLLMVKTRLWLKMVNVQFSDIHCIKHPRVPVFKLHLKMKLQ